jgi:hypothetical protein
MRRFTIADSFHLTQETKALLAISGNSFSIMQPPDIISRAISPYGGFTENIRAYYALFLHICQLCIPPPYINLKCSNKVADMKEWLKIAILSLFHHFFRCTGRTKHIG